MYIFEEHKSSEASLLKRKRVYAAGINDADYVTYPRLNGKRKWCPFFRVWHNMIQRCYSKAFLKNNPSYEDAFVCEEWLRFTNFKKWMLSQQWENMQLDKDIKNKGNKVYSKQTCLFIPQALNTAMNQHASRDRKLPVGVFKKRGKYQAQISDKAKVKNLGSFVTVKEAEEAYLEARKKKLLLLVKHNTYPIATSYIEQHI